MKTLAFVREAKRQSTLSDHPQHKVGCVIVFKNRIIGKGFNKIKTHTKSNHPFKMIHAELDAVLNANGNVEGATAYVFRAHKNGDWVISRPCNSCWQYLMQCGIKNVVYSYEGSYKEERLT